ncbi:hypothetical protein MAR_007751 [Mya arenaria]|uniref:EB domain-containing protein n=1 Tax=Mya arenaria TaxID=6604 RepID=A0ABY7DX22_MYAAR|nr:hypothetical protein MAR_007751 [Mya arenaria]
MNQEWGQRVQLAVASVGTYQVAIVTQQQPPQFVPAVRRIPRLQRHVLVLVTCTADSVCVTLDANSMCYNGKCQCKAGYSVNPSGTNLCVTTFGSGAKSIVGSITVLIGSLLLAMLYM